MTKYYLVNTINNSVLRKTDNPESSKLMDNTIWVIGENSDHPIYDPLTKTIIDADSLQYAIEEKCNQIDIRTEKLIDNGASFDDEIFSMSQNAQINWASLNILFMQNKFPDDGKLIPTKDSDMYLLHKEDVADFMGAVWMAKEGPIMSGGQLRVQVKALKTVAEVKAFVDPR